jgi:hydrogenase/urease accessory protein HupE
MLTEPVSIAVLVAVTIAVLQAFKAAIDIPEKFKPLMAVVVGVILTILADQTPVFTVTIFKSLFLNGIMIGLTAAGLYDNKAIVGK